MPAYPPKGPASFEALLEPLPEDIRDAANQLRAIIKAAIPEADEAVSGGAKMGMALYSVGGANNVLCGIQPTEKTCKLFFHEWERLKSAGYRMEGSGKNARHVKVSSAQELEPELIAEMIQIVAERRRAS